VERKLAMDQAASLLLGEERDGEWVVGGV